MVLWGGPPGPQPAPRPASVAVGLLCALCLCASPAEPEPVSQVLRELNAALQEGNAAGFLARIDRRRCPDYGALEDNVVALVAQNEIGSSVGVVEQKKNGEAYEFKIDWLLQLRPAGGGPVRKRQGTISCRIELAGKKWKVTAIAPVSFFGP